MSPRFGPKGYLASVLAPMLRKIEPFPTLAIVEVGNNAHLLPNFLIKIESVYPV